MTAPGEAAIRAVQRRLRAQQGAFVPKPALPGIDELVATVLSQHTSDVNSERAFARLKAAFPTWEQVADAPAELVAGAIRCGGIADQKARRIKQILAAIEEREGRIDLGRLRDLDDAAAEAYLESLPGVGPKTAACVLLFAMGRAAFPIDTHVHRIATRLGWIPANTTADKAHRLLAPRVPPDIRYDLHIAMVAHGRTFCRAQRPRCDVCVLRNLCAYGRAVGSRVGTDGRPEGRPAMRSGAGCALGDWQRRALGVIRGLLHRGGSTVMIFAGALVASAAAATGPVYYAAARTSILHDTVASTSYLGRGFEANVTGA